MRIELKVKAGSRRNRIETCQERLVLETTAPPHDGAANKQVVEMLADYYHVAKSKIKIVQGVKNNHKIVEIN